MDTSDPLLSNTLTVSEIMYRDVVAIEKALLKGPIQLIHQNRPVAVMLSPSEYARIIGPSLPTNSNATLDWLLSLPPGKMTPNEIQQWMREERASWK